MTTLLSVLGDPLVQILSFVFGSLAIRRIVKKNRVRRGVAAPKRRRRLAPGYRGLKWGEAPRTEMVLYHDGLVEKLYTRQGEKLTLGAAPVKSVLYSYHLGRLQAVMIEIQRRSAPEALAHLVAEWGQPRFLGVPGARKSYWKDLGKGADAMQAIFDDVSAPPLASLVVSSKAVVEQLLLDQRPIIRTQQQKTPRLAAAMEAAR
jgi:hypothetical protein